MNFSQDQLGNKLGNVSHVQHQPTEHQVDFCSCQINEKQGLMCIKRIILRWPSSQILIYQVFEKYCGKR